MGIQIWYSNFFYHEDRVHFSDESASNGLIVESESLIRVFGVANVGSAVVRHIIVWRFLVRCRKSACWRIATASRIAVLMGWIPWLLSEKSCLRWWIAWLLPGINGLRWWITGLLSGIAAMHWWISWIAARLRWITRLLPRITVHRIRAAVLLRWIARVGSGSHCVGTAVILCIWNIFRKRQHTPY